ncbi:MAG: hypothetical protein LQ345_002174 [Seirophora villosa]|nr:MAG: hypothetical protein LQ345_002174 [Seirophora villosa]
MRICLSTSALLVASLAVTPIAAQTYTTCNPLTSGNCPADPALGRAVAIDFTAGVSDSFTPQGNPTYDSNGASFTVAKSGDSPQLTSKWYIMFGHVEFQLKAAPGVGIVSSAVLQSDALDEIDFEWLGGDSSQVQSNYFGKGQTTTYNRGAYHPDPNNQAAFHTYAIDWTADQIAWQIDGKTVRTLSPDAAQGQYPQTPMMIKIGAWSGGDPANAPGTISWATGGAGGTTDYTSGPYSMVVKSIAVTDYSTGTQYSYSGTSGTWQSIQSEGGKISSSGSKAVGPVEAGSSSSSTSESAPLPFTGTHKGAEVTPDRSGYPWVATTLATSTTAPTTYPNLPSGYKTSQPAISTLSPQDSSGASPADGELETVVAYDQRGFPTTIVQAEGATRQYDDRGFLITASLPLAARSSPTAAVAQAVDGRTSAGAEVNKEVTKTSAAISRNDMTELYFVAACGLAALTGTLAL